MSSTVINMLLKRIAGGDKAAIKTLCVHLADRLVFVPTIASTSDSATGSTTIEIVRIVEGAQSFVPVFTTDRTWKEWKKANGHEGDALNLLGADLCAALGNEACVAVDPGSKFSIRLSPDDVRLVADVEIDENTLEDSAAEDDDWGQDFKPKQGKAMSRQSTEAVDNQPMAPASLAAEAKQADDEPSNTPPVVPAGFAMEAPLIEEDLQRSAGRVTETAAEDGDLGGYEPQSYTRNTGAGYQPAPRAPMEIGTDSQDIDIADDVNYGSADSMEQVLENPPGEVPPPRGRKDTKVDLLRPALHSASKGIHSVDDEPDSVTSTVIIRSSMLVGTKKGAPVKDGQFGELPSSEDPGNTRRRERWSWLSFLAPKK